jgi:hypothetical protein
MSGILKTIFTMIGSTIKFTAISAGVIIVTVSGICYYIKPDDKTFKKYFNNFISKQSGLGSNRNACLFERVMKNIISSGLQKTCEIEIKDYLVIKVADVHVPDGDHIYFVGAAHNWFPMK